MRLPKHLFTKHHKFKIEFGHSTFSDISYLLVRNTDNHPNVETTKFSYGNGVVGRDNRSDALDDIKGYLEDTINGRVSEDPSIYNNRL